jgi:PBP1b-binding outer membrane lipoprotein LpoB
MRQSIAAIAIALLLGACTMAPPPDKQSAAAQKADQHTELRDAINAPIDKAKAANDANIQRNKDDNKAIEDAGG